MNNNKIAIAVLAVSLLSFGSYGGHGLHAEEKKPESDSRISDKVINPIAENFPERPAPLIEWGDDLLGPGKLSEGFVSPTGAVWRPSLIVYGTFRSALQYFDTGGSQKFTEWANQLNLFANLSLTASERFVLGFRFLDGDPTTGSNLTGYVFEPDSNKGYVNGSNTQVERFFFEGDLAELFPGLDPDGTAGLDIGFSIGRQPISFQEGIIINDIIDSIGITQNSIRIGDTSNIRITALYGWGEVHRNGVLDNESELYGLFFASDHPSTSINIDLIYLDNQQGVVDRWFSGISFIQRIGLVNTAFRGFLSDTVSDPDNTPLASLVTFEVSIIPVHTDDLVYINGYYGEDNFIQAGLEPGRSGPLSRIGIIYDGAGIGNYAAALTSNPGDSYGVSMGWQTFFGPLYGKQRRQLIVEVGGRNDQSSLDNDSVALAVRYQEAFGTRLVIRLDGFVAEHSVASDNRGVRSEILIKF